MAKRKPSELGTSSDWIAARFRDERARLELTHAGVAKATGVSRNGAMAWEKGTAIPSHALAALSELGLDPQYVLTGLRSQNLDVLRGGSPKSVPSLTPDEWATIRDLRALSDVQREQARAMLKVLKVGMPVSGNVVIGKGRSRVAGRDFTEGAVKRKG